jgi:hypothetical protein
MKPLEITIVLRSPVVTCVNSNASGVVAKL